MQQQGRNDERNLRRDLGLIPATALVVKSTASFGDIFSAGYRRLFMDRLL
ncbi:MAG: hypothetical protein K0Q75_497 [Anaerospora sp.]|nr:hypothetical protein [Anaerospora sp.]